MASVRRSERCVGVTLRLTRGKVNFATPGPVINTIVIGGKEVVNRKCREGCNRLRTRERTLTTYARRPRKTSVCIALRPYYRCKGRPPYIGTVLRTKVEHIVVKSSSPGPLITKGKVQVLGSRKVRMARGVLGRRDSGLGRTFFCCVRGGGPCIIVGCTVAVSKGVTTCANRSG